MSLFKIEKRALFSVDDKSKADHFGRKLLELGEWRIHSYGGTQETLRSRGVAVTDIDLLIGKADERQRRKMAVKIAQHLARPQLELEEQWLVGIDLVYMIPKQPRLEPNNRWHDIGYVRIMRTAMAAGKIIVSSNDQIDSVVEWLQQGQPPDSVINIESLASAAELYVDNYVALAAA